MQFETTRRRIQACVSVVSYFKRSPQTHTRNPLFSSILIEVAPTSDNDEQRQEDDNACSRYQYWEAIAPDRSNHCSVQVTPDQKAAWSSYTYSSTSTLPSACLDAPQMRP